MAAGGAVDLILQLLLLRPPPLGVEPPVLPLDCFSIVHVGVALFIAFARLLFILVLVLVIFVLQGQMDWSPGRAPVRWVRLRAR